MRTILSVAAKPLTWDDIKDWPEDNSQYTELVNGELIMSPAPGGRHQVIVSELVLGLMSYVKPARLGRILTGPVDVILVPDLVFQPDLCFIRRDRLSIVQKQILPARSLHRNHL